MCDGDDGECGAWTVDHYEETASSVGDVPITKGRPAPGWVTTPDDDDLCPDHADTEDR